MDTRRIDVGELALEVLEAGAGAPRRLLLLHGYTAAKDEFADHIDDLAAHGWHAVAPDLRGHGDSDSPDDEGAYSLRIFAADALALADALGWPRFVLLGHSMGGMVAQLVALEQPERLEALVLMGTGHAAPEGIHPNVVEMGKAIVRDGGTELLVQIMAAMEEGGHGPSVDAPLSSEAHRRLAATRPGYAERHRRNIARASNAMWLAMAAELTEHPDRLEHLRELAVPTLVVVGEQDASFLAQSQRMAEVIPEARLAVLPDAGHAPHFEAPDAWWEVVTGFLDEVGARNREVTR